MAQNPVSNMQASVALTQYMPLQGIFPSQGGGGGNTGFYLGEIGTFAGSLRSGRDNRQRAVRSH